MSPVKPVPINGDVLAWAMREAGLDDQALAARLHTSSDAVASWRTGRTQPGVTKFRQISQVLKRPSAFFLRTSPPTDQGLPPSFRHRAGGAPGDEITPSERDAVRTARRIQSVQRWLRQRDNRPPVVLGSVSEARHPESEASRVADTLGWSFSSSAATSPTDLTRRLRTWLEARGVIVLLLSIGEEGCRGFSLSDAHAPVIAINTGYKGGARPFTLLHELAHLLRGDDSVCAGYARTAGERWCERFAAAFLMPRGEVEAWVDRQIGVGGVITAIADVRATATNFNVSARAAAIRLEEVGRGADGLYDAVDAGLDFTSGGFGGGGETRPQKRLREFGLPYAKALLDAERAGVIGRYELLDYLRIQTMDVEPLRALAEVGPEDER